MDETAVWLDCGYGRTIETKGAKDVIVLSTGHEKSRITVCLRACEDGKKFMPYVLVNRKRPVPHIDEKFKRRLIISWAGTTWMNDELTEDYLRKVHGMKMFGPKRLLAWDAFRCHKSESTIKILRELGIIPAIVPGGCTKFIQAPDVSWNKPFKQRITENYELWLHNGDRQVTRSGNPKAPDLEIALEWIDMSWSEIPKELIVKSFEGWFFTKIRRCRLGLTTPLDGSGDDRIACFKPGGLIGTRGLDILRKMRQEDKARDGHVDFEESGLELSDQEVDVSLENLDDDDLFMDDVEIYC